MSEHKGRRGNKQNRNKVDVEAEVNDDNPIIINFKKYAKELDDKHDRYEKIVKLSRDITIESKRIIFLLHTIDPKKQNREKVSKEAEKRLQTLCEVNFLSIAKELGNLDPYQYARAYSFGLQEFVEAYTFYESLNEKNLSDWTNLQEKLNYEVTEKIKGGDDEQAANKVTKYSCLVQPVEFILGLADLTGEIMRRCINSLGSGDIETCFESCRVLQAMYSGYIGLSTAYNRELSRKIYTLRQSVLKTEDVCYNVKIRGGEAGKAGFIFNTEKNFEEDEGFF